MSESERRIAGLSCSEVLAALPDLLDNEVDDDRRERIDRHLAACDWCARFGGEYAEAIDALRQALGHAPPASERMRHRLRSRLAGDPRP